MAVFDPSLTADKAAATMPPDMLNASGKPNGPDGPLVDSVFQTKGILDFRRRGKRVIDNLGPELDEVVEARKERVHIFNVGAYPHIIPCGSAGVFVIPACNEKTDPEGKGYVEMITPLLKVETEIYPKGIKGEAPKRLYDNGARMAIEILGEGRSQDKRQSRRHVGVFIAQGEVPTKKELDAARKEWLNHCSERVQWMDMLYERDRKLAHDTYRHETMGVCAKALGLTGKEKGWLAQGEPTNKVKCEACHVLVDPDVAICYNCKSPVNLEAYAEYRKRLRKIEDDPEPDAPVRGRRG